MKFKRILPFFSAVWLLATACTPLSTPTATATEQPAATSTEQPAATPTTTPPALAYYERVRFETSDGVRLSGRIFGDGPTAVILAHMGGETQGSWYNMAKLLSDAGFTVLTFDFRGVGQSEGMRLLSQAPVDLQAAVDLLEQRGHTRIACVGASYGGTACMAVAKSYPFIGLAVLSSRFTEGSPNGITRDELAELSMPKLFVTTDGDHLNIPNIVQEMYDVSQEPKQILIYSGNVHGTALFFTVHGSELEQALLQFLLPLL